MEEQDIVILIGSPGTGKSTLINCLHRSVVSKSGMSIGSGLTLTCNEYRVGDRVLIDTPGLSDCDREVRIKVAEDLRRVLQRYSGKRVKIVFVFTLNEGRYQQQDDTCLFIIQQALKQGGNYSIIFNKVSPRLFKVFDYNVITSCSKEIRSNSVFVIPRREEMECKPNYLLEPDQAFFNFVQGAPTCVIPQVVDEIDVFYFDSDQDYIKQQMERKCKNLQQENMALALQLMS
jgi:GTPase Era involved in 16S rRNA processing